MMKQLVDPEFVSELLSVARIGWNAMAKKGRQTGRRPGTAGRGRAVPLVHVQRAHVKNAMRLVNRKRLKGVDIPLRYPR